MEQNKKQNYKLTAIVVAIFCGLGMLHYWVGEYRERKNLRITNSVSLVWPQDRQTFRSSKVELMGTFARITVVTDDQARAQNAIEAAIKELERVEDMMSAHMGDSELALLNKSAWSSDFVASKELFELIQKSIEFSKLSDGEFDVSVGPLIQLWHTADVKGSQPTQEQIEEAKNKVGYEKLILDKEKHTIRFAVEGMSIDLGAIAKGYGIDKAVETLQRAGVIGGLVDVGGDIRCFGAPPAGEMAWVVGLQDPKAADMYTTDETVLARFVVSNCAVATSGDYRRYVEVDGQRQSHILDPKTSHGAKGLSSVSIFAPDATTADAMATTVSVLGFLKGLDLVEKMPQVEAVVILDEDGFDIQYSSGAMKYCE